MGFVEGLPLKTGKMIGHGGRTLERVRNERVKINGKAIKNKDALPPGFYHVPL